MHILPGFRICVALVYLYNEKAGIYRITGINFFFLISGVPESVWCSANNFAGEGLWK